MGLEESTKGSVRERVKALRTALGLTQEQLAERSGVRRSEINKIENGKNRCTSGRIREGLAKGFGLPLEAAVSYLDGRSELTTARNLIAKLERSKRRRAASEARA